MAMTSELIFAINPGTTSTRLALFRTAAEGVLELATQNFDHSEAELAQYSSISGQLAHRRECAQTFLKEALVPDDRIVACAGRGGMLTPVPAGVIAISDALVRFALETPVYHHASNLGAPLAASIAKEYGVPAFIADPVSVDELPPIARISGCPELPRFSFVHALNIRACGRRRATEQGKGFDDLRAVIAHLGAGFSIAALVGGQIVDSSNRMELSPFTPERAGGLPPLPLIELCYSGALSKEDLLTKLYGKGGVYSYLGTKDIRKVEAMIAAGDAKARLVHDAMIYQIAKAIGAMAAVAEFDLDAVILTGGLANSQAIVEALRARIGRLAPMVIYPGSNECQALAEATARVLQGKEKPMEWPVQPAATVAQ